MVLRLLPLLLILPLPLPAQELAKLPAPGEVRAAFRKLLDRPRVPLDVQVVAAPKVVGDFIEEVVTFVAEKKADGQVERVPVLLVKPVKLQGRAPVVIVLHGTGGTRESYRGWLTDLARRGIIGVAIDARYHGARVPGRKGAEAYNEATIRAWRSEPGKPHEHPFWYDTCWDLWRLVDYLETRPDVDAKRIGMCGISMGGIETWLAGTTDERVAVLVPLIGVQSMRWSLENDRWQARANTIRAAHEAAAKDLGEPRVNARVCRELWAKILPGILDRFDCPSMLRLAAGRPMLILNGEKDPNCPLEGARLAFAEAEKAYRAAGAAEKLKIQVAAGVAHRVTEEHRQATLDWFVRWLKP